MWKTVSRTSPILLNFAYSNGWSRAEMENMFSRAKVNIKEHRSPL
jgi:hypothetical protein